MRNQIDYLTFDGASSAWKKNKKKLTFIYNVVGQI